MPSRDAAPLAVVLTSHNRRATTLHSLAALNAQEGCPLPIRIYLMDDGSRDGTRDAVVREYPDAVVLKGPGDLYWSGGMRRAMARASRDRPAAFLWLNDDTRLLPGALANLARVSSRAPGAIVVGTAIDPGTGAVTYGGLRRRSSARFRFDRVSPGATPLPCDTFNGNAVWIPAAVPEQIGYLDPMFQHAMADIDYGLRASRSGIPLLVAPGAVAHCALNDPAGTWRDPGIGRLSRIAAVKTPKGLPPRQWAHLLRRHGGRAWPAQWASPYVKIILGAWT